MSSSPLLESGLYARRGKRCLDLLAAMFGLAILGMPMAIVAVWIRLVDGSPVIFRQERVGRNGVVFRICKFRTMANSNGAGTTISIAGDGRVTKTGRWLRRLKIDELPQLFNVLWGEMSIVGPRPDVPDYTGKLTGEAREILQVRPGITGPASIAFRNEEEILAKAKDPQLYNDEVIFPLKIRLNLDYVRTVSLRRDIGFIVRTVLLCYRNSEPRKAGFVERMMRDRRPPII